LYLLDTATYLGTHVELFRNEEQCIRGIPEVVVSTEQAKFLLRELAGILAFRSECILDRDYTQTSSLPWIIRNSGRVLTRNAIKGVCMCNCVALIVAAGNSKRFGGKLPKQYQELVGQPVLRRTVEAFLTHPKVDKILVVIDPAHRALYDQALTGVLNKLSEPVAGGAQRHDSVRLGLKSLATSIPRPHLVLIHDAARPLIDAVTIDRVIDSLQYNSAAIPAIPITDTLKYSTDGLSTTTVDRKHLWRVQTPQGFYFEKILTAYLHLNTNLEMPTSLSKTPLTDDAAVAEQAGLAITLVPGVEENIKVTTEDDLARAARILIQEPIAEFRTGNGFDVHRFMPGDHVVLCGVSIPHNFGLEGHSDADVALHALTDAILGAIGAGDIGQFFPESDPKWYKCNSVQFLQHAIQMATALKGRIVNLDVTLICEKPKIGPYRSLMAKNLSTILNMQQSRVSIKATTTERLGFTGRQEGIAALATATVWLPTTKGQSSSES
jgi:2-C-methyl-D-erythritol 4-phosphate cytidylyltransferase/2-C-methyl-D-erythritol 2,4-cyclodiphosphate synthase